MLYTLDDYMLISLLNDVEYLINNQEFVQNEQNHSEGVLNFLYETLSAHFDRASSSLEMRLKI